MLRASLDKNISVDRISISPQITRLDTVDLGVFLRVLGNAA
jgi:hypothetical protein